MGYYVERVLNYLALLPLIVIPTIQFVRRHFKRIQKFIFKC